MTVRPTSTALAGLAVLVLVDDLVEPVCDLTARLLEDQGAVVKVGQLLAQQEEGRPLRAGPLGPQRSTRLLLNAGTPAGRRDLDAEIRASDVVIEALRPSAADSLELTPDAVTAIDPRTVHVSLPAFGRADPRADQRGTDATLSAMVGLHTTMAYSDMRIGDIEEVAFNPLPVASTYASVYGAAAVVAALLVREETGHGQHIEVARFNALLTALGCFCVEGSDVVRSLVPRLPMMQIYRAGDGRYVQFHGTFARDRFIDNFLEQVGRHEWIDEARRARRGCSLADVDMWRARFQDIFASRTAREWEDLLNSAGSVATTCRTPAEWLAEPHAVQGGFVLDVGEGAQPLLLGPAVKVSASGEPAVPGSEQPVGKRAPGDPPLHGIRVLDLSIVIAGPAAGRVLAEFGADVIKIDDPHGEPPTDDIQLEVNRGKRSLYLDLKTPNGRKRLWEMVADCDVLLHNFIPGKLERLGFGRDDVAARHPHVVYASLNAFGPDGPWKARPGWEQNAQAATGMQVRWGGPGQPPRSQPYPLNDYGCSILGAFAVLLGLWSRHQTGRGAHAMTSLTHAACALSSSLLVDGEPRTEDWGSQQRLNESAYRGLYRTADGWLCVDADTWHARQSLLDFPDDGVRATARRALDNPLDPRADESLCSSLSAQLVTQPAAHWVDVFEGLDIPSAERLSLAEFKEQPYLTEQGHLRTRPVDGRSDVRFLEPQAVSMSASSMVRPSPLARLGLHTEELVGAGTPIPSREARADRGTVSAPLVSVATGRRTT